MTASGPGGAADGLRILVVEDDRIIGFLLTEMLADLGHEVCGVERTENAAVDAAIRLMPDLVLMDAHLAAGTGAGAMARILKNGPVPHLFMSGLPIMDLPRGTTSLLKPFSQEALARGIGDSFAAGPGAKAA